MDFLASHRVHHGCGRPPTERLRLETAEMRRTTWALVAWTAVGTVGIWASDAASHATGAGPGQAAGLTPPAWVLFEVWATGFVLLGAIWNREPTAADAISDRVRMEERPNRRTTWAVLAWTALWIVLFGLWALDPDPSIVGEGPASGGLLHLKPPDWALFDFWAIGFAVLGAFWLVTRMWSARHPRARSV